MQNKWESEAAIISLLQRFGEMENFTDYFPAKAVDTSWVYIQPCLGDMETIYLRGFRP